MKKSKVLFLAQLPPPIHGASMMNKYIKDSKIINNAFNTFFLPLQFADKIDDIGKPSFKKIFKMIGFTFKLVKKLFKIKPKLVYFTLAPFGGAFYRDALFVFLIKLFRVKIIFHLHGKGIIDESKNVLKRKIYQLTFKNTYVITLSEMLDDDIVKVHYGKIFHLPNGIEFNESKNNNQQKENLKILYLSNLVITKGVLDLVEAIALIPDLNIEYQVDIVGNSGDISIEELKTIIEDKGISAKIKVLGPKYGNEKWDILQNSDIFVLPTYFKNECFPLVLLEAMQANNAIISTNNGAIEEIIKNCGIIVSQNSPQELAVALEELILDKKRVQILKEKSKIEIEEKYTVEIFENNFIQILNSVLSETI
jgi:glycosyltransferase involved in cell wall biosynthesis